MRPRLKIKPVLAETQVKLIFDSGAFSAWKLGKPIDRDAYHDFLAANEEWIETAIALDVIIPDSPEQAARESYANWEAANKRGVITMPVFHARESFDWLDRYLDAGCSYIGISGSSLPRGNQADDWYSLVWDHIGNDRGLPTVKTHCFGEGREHSLMRFPWYSADSTSWIYTAQRTGVISIDGKRLSQRNDGANSREVQDIASLDGEDVLHLNAFLARHGVKREGFDERGVLANTLRTYLAAKHYLDMNQRINARCPIHHKRSNLFGSSHNGKPVHIPELKFYLVIGDNCKAWVPFILAGGVRGLVSYFYVDNPEHYSIRDFVYDPHRIIASVEPMKRYYDLMKDYVKC
jgi:hypothetical protein